MKNIRNLEFKNKVILITGSNGVLGKSIAHFFLSCNAKLILTDLRKKNFFHKGNNFDFYQCDLSNYEQTNNFIDRVKKKYQRIDILINNAAATGTLINNSKMIEGTKYWDSIFRINLFSIYDLILGFKKNLLKSSHPSVINIASIYGSIVPDFSIYNETKISNPPEYSCSKAALIYLTKWISKNFINKIRVNSISPGGIYRKQEKIFIEKYKKKTKFNRMTYEKDILNSIIFLASAKSGYVTGQNIIVDGGFSN